MNCCREQQQNHRTLHNITEFTKNKSTFKNITLIKRDYREDLMLWYIKNVLGFASQKTRHFAI